MMGTSLEEVNNTVNEIENIKTGMKLEKDIARSNNRSGMANFYLLRYRSNLYFIPLYWDYNSDTQSISRIYIE